MKKLILFLSKYYLVVSFLLLFPVMHDRALVINPRSVIWSDCEGYYKYLPGVFILGDVAKVPEGSVWPLRNERGEILLKYTCGVAMLEAPFFLAAVQYSKWKGQDWQDIFHRNYARAVGIGGFLCCFLGLALLKRTLLRYFSKGVTFWTLLCVCLAAPTCFTMPPAKWACRMCGRSFCYRHWCGIFPAGTSAPIGKGQPCWVSFWVGRS
jgi:hypothetical protein